MKKESKEHEDISDEAKKLAGFMAQKYENEHNYKKASLAYELAGKPKDAERAAKKLEAAEALGAENYASLEKVLYSVAKAVMVVSSIGLVFSFFAKPKVISVQEIQLAPPMPNYMIYVLLALLIASAVYLFIKKNKKKSRIPLSF